MKLYEIAPEYNDLMQLIEAGELTAEAAEDTLQAMNFAFEDKARSCVMIVRQLQADSAGISAEIDRLKKLQKSTDSSAESLLEYVKHEMMFTHKEKLDLGIFKLSLRAATKAVSVLDESKIPSEYFRVIPESKAVDKVALASALKVGDIEGAELVDGKRSLIIK
jgi:hypothetical protein